MPVDFIGLAKERYSLRRFDAREVEEEKLQGLLAACRLAPTACNNQPWRVLVIRSAEGLAKLKGCTRYHFDAPLALLVCADQNEAWRRGQDGQSSDFVDASIVGTHLMLQATALGLGSTWVMAFDPEAMRAAYSIPAHITPVALFPLGYPAEGAGPSRLHEDRRPAEETTVYESF